MALGSNWKDQVVDESDRSTHVLALIGEAWMDGVDDDGRVAGGADAIVFELEEAFRRNVAVVPVLLGDREMPTLGELPAPLRRHGFPDLNAARIRADSPRADIDALRDSFAELDGDGSSGGEQRAARFSRSSLRSVGVVVVVVALGALVG